MSKQLYEEALADVRKLKEIAEDNAKKALIEAVSPRIKDLIEAELLREADEKEEEEKDDLLLDINPEAMKEPEMAVPASDTEVAAAMSLPDEEGKVTLDLDALKVEPAEEVYELSNESINKLVNPLVGQLNSATALRVESKLFQLGEAVEKFMEADKTTQKSESFQKKINEMVSEIESLYEYLQESAGGLQDKTVYEGKLERLYKQLNKLVEQENMKNLKALTEEDVTLKLTGMPEDIDLDSIGVDLVTGGEEAEEAEEAGEEEMELDLGGEEEAEEAGEEAAEEAGEEAGEEAEATQAESLDLSDDTIVEISESMLRDEIARMRSLREETEPAAWGDGAGEVSDEFIADDMGDALELDITTEADDDKDQVKHMKELDKKHDQKEAQKKQDKKPQHEMDKSDKDEAKHMKDEADMDEMYELDEMTYEMDKDQKEEAEMKDEADMKQAVDRPGSRGQVSSMGPGAGSSKRGRTPGTDVAEAEDKKEEAKDEKVHEARVRLSREMKIQAEAKKKATQAKKQQKEAQMKSKKAQQEAQMAAKKKQKQEAVKKQQEAQKQAKEAKKMAEAYSYFANIFNESVRRAGKLQSVLAESQEEVVRNGASTESSKETSVLRQKLAETNLFNTKLLYCNKLLQNEALTKRQKAEVIERLDEAKSEREVKLVYETLVKTLSGSPRRVTEGTSRVLGSSSQATRPASSVISEGYEADRWARLAGLK